MRKYPFYRQFDLMDCGPTCVRMIAKFHGKLFSREYLDAKTGYNLEGVSVEGIVEAAEAIHLKSLPVLVTYEVLQNQAPLPCVAYWQQKHFVVLYEVNRKNVVMADPNIGILKYSKKEFLEGWKLEDVPSGETEGLLILMEPTVDFDKEHLFEEQKKEGLKLLTPYLKPHKKTITQLLLGLVAVTIIQLIIPFLTQAVVDYGINYKNLHFIYILLAAQLMLFFSMAFLEIIRDWLLLHFGSKISLTFISDYLKKLMGLPINFFEARKIGDVLQRIDDHENIEKFLSAQSLMMLFSVFNMMVFGVILAYFHIYIFIIYLIGTTLYIIWVQIFMKKREIIDHMKFEQLGVNQTNLIQLVQGIQEIKLNNSEQKRRWEWEETRIKLYSLAMKSLSIYQKQTTGGQFISELKNIFITFISAKLVIDGMLTLGTMLSIQYILGQLNRPLIHFVEFVIKAQEARISIDRIHDVMNRETEEKRERQIQQLGANQDIILDNVSFGYPGNSSIKVLNNLNVVFPTGKVTAIVGVSGSGKTTLLKLLLKFYKPSGGKINIGKYNLEEVDTRFWRKLCGAVMQDGFIFDDSIRRNITESEATGRVDKIQLSEAARIANITEVIESLPAGFNSKLGYQGSNISGGQKQRVLIARAVYKNPEYLFFDEATSALDANNEKIIMENLEDFYNKRTVIVIAHRLSTVKSADQIIVMDKGKIVESGTHKSLTEERGKYLELVKNQLELGS